MERIERLAQANKCCWENLCDSACLFYEECQNADRPFSLDDEIIKEVQKLVDENRALRTELHVNGKKCFVDDNKTLPDQTAKQDNGKLDPTLVPTEIIWAIAAVRREGVKKYKDPFNYRRVEKERLRAAAFRHFLKYLKDPEMMDEETGLPHLFHCCTNLSFLCEMEGYEYG